MLGDIDCRKYADWRTRWHNYSWSLQYKLEKFTLMTFGVVKHIALSFAY